MDFGKQHTAPATRHSGMSSRSESEWHRRMTPGEIGKNLRAKGFTPEFVDDEPRTYLPESALGRIYIDGEGDA